MLSALDRLDFASALNYAKQIITYNWPNETKGSLQAILAMLYADGSCGVRSQEKAMYWYREAIKTVVQMPDI